MMMTTKLYGNYETALSSSHILACRSNLIHTVFRTMCILWSHLTMLVNCLRWLCCWIVVCVLRRLCWFEPVDSLRFVRIIARKSIAPLELSVKILCTPHFVHSRQSVDIYCNVHEMRKLKMITHSYDCWFSEGRRQNNTSNQKTYRNIMMNEENKFQT